MKKRTQLSIRCSLGLLCLVAAANAQETIVTLNCEVLGMSAFWTDGGRRMVVGSIEELRCGGDVIELETTDITDNEIATKEYGRLRFEVPSLTSPNIVFVLTAEQVEKLSEYAVR